MIWDAVAQFLKPDQHMLFTYTIVLSKDTVLRYLKNKNVMVPGFFKYWWYRVPGQPGSWFVQPYDFRDAENADGISESSHKNRIYSVTRNVMEFAKV